MASCSRCQGAKVVKCPNCGGETVGTPEVSTSGWMTRTVDGKVIVTAYFLNKEDIGVYGKPTAELLSTSQKSYKASAQSMFFPPHEQVEATIIIDGISFADYSYFLSQQFLRPVVTVSDLENVVCSVCGGDGYIVCPDCGGVDVDDGRDQTDNTIIDSGGRQREDVSVSLPFDWPLLIIGIVAAAAVGAVVVTRVRRVTEKDLRKYSSTKFHNWVVQRLGGKVASPGDSRMGIDGYTAEGHPIKIMQSDNIGRNAIDNFASVLSRTKTKNGLIVAFSFSDDVYRGLVRAKRNYRIEIRKVTISELVSSRKM